RLARVIAERCASRAWRDNGEPSASHTQQDSGTICITAGREPTEIVGCAIFAFQHGNSSVREIRRCAPFGCLDISSHRNFPYQAHDVPAASNVAPYLLPNDDEHAGAGPGTYVASVLHL